MKQQLSTGLRTTLLLNFVIGGIVGVQHLIAPRIWTDLAGIEITSTVTWRLIGAALIGFAVSSWLVHRANEWAQARIVVIMHIVWSTLGALAILWALFYENLPPLEWVNALLLLGFAGAFAIFYARQT